MTQYRAANQLSKTLTLLMKECNIDDSLLSRKTGIPASSLARIKNDPQANPTIATLLPIARFFNISIGQLIGDEPLPVSRIEGQYNNEVFTNAKVPILKWENVLGWLIKSDNLERSKLDVWISTEKHVHDNAFALQVKNDVYGLYIRKDSTIIVDPGKDPINGDLVLITDKSNELYIKQIIKESKLVFLKSINPEIKNTEQLVDQLILGIIIETRYNIQENTVKRPAKTQSISDKILALFPTLLKST